MEVVAVREVLGRGLGRARLCRTSPGRRHSWPQLRTAASPKLGHAALCNENFPENIKDKKTGIKRNYTINKVICIWYALLDGLITQPH